jgi:uncharacterized membrane protein
MDWRADVWSRFRAELPFLVVVWALVIAGFVGYDIVRGREVDPVALVAAFIVVAVAMTPLIWIRHERPVVRTEERRFRRTLAVVGVGCVWAVVALLAGVVVVALLGID